VVGYLRFEPGGLGGCATFKGRRLINRIVSGKRLLPVFLVAALALLASFVYAHTPLEAEGGGSIESAQVIPTPSKSWTLYEELHEPGEPHYYRVDLGEGEKLVVSLFVSVGEASSFTPSLAVMGPDIGGGDADYGLEVPEGYGLEFIEGNRSLGPEYEPFTPASYIYLAKIRHEPEAPGIYYFAVIEPEQGGRSGLAVGYVEEFTALEWVMVPVDVFGIKLWEGQSPFLVFGPLVAVLAVGAWYVNSREKIEGAHMWLGLGASMLYVGTAVNMFTQMALALVASGFSGGSLLTSVFISVQLGLGYAFLQKTLRDRGKRDIRNRLVVVGYAVLGLLVWAGVLVGPALLLASAVIPES
jgi:hypothetical protein